MELLEHPAQLWRDPVRKRYWGPGTNPDDLDMRDFSESSQKFCQFLILKKQRISS
jgi:hypothetical protein